MNYYLDENSIDLDALQDRLQSTDLIPSQEPLLDRLSENMSSLTGAGIQSLADLRLALKITKSLEELAKKSDVEVGYLQLLRRAINGFFPKPKSLKEVDWLGDDLIAKLNKAGLKNTKHLFELTSDNKADLIKETGVDQAKFNELSAIADLCRIQWVSPTFARVLVAAGFDNAHAIASADPEAVFNAMEEANKGARYYKGKVGLRDVARLVAAAKYVP
ncbi:DUF4332 domain-containing protein [Yoonia maritima]|uniref:DUF4332 domain-containing protein n=1 Tax=Yoonia maritima TaxID=1435347 RepID=UPI003736E25A